MDPAGDGSLHTAAYPMVDEGSATGRVAGVYGAILQRFPMVPSLFKSLAVCPGYLELAWQQTSQVLDHDDFTDATDGLVAEAVDAVPPPPDAEVRDLVARFVQPLARMLVAAAGLRLALDGSLDGPPAEPAPLVTPPSLTPALQVPPTGELDPAPVGAVRADLATPIVNSIWRVAAANGLLPRAWQHFGPLTSDPALVRATTRIGEYARAAAQTLDWPAVASRDALHDQNLDDAAEGAAAILDTYLATLPRVLALVASSQPVERPDKQGSTDDG
jgi:hypothetical protein